MADRPGRRSGPPRSTKTAANFWIWPLLVLIAALLASRWTQTSVDTWYPLLTKPAWTPPNWIYAPAWAALYFMMTVAIWRISRRKGSPARSVAMILFLIQLILNALWPFCFFVLHHLALASAEIFLLLAVVMMTMKAFWDADRTAGTLLLPYVLWLCYATALTFAIWMLNFQF